MKSTLLTYYNLNTHTKKKETTLKGKYQSMDNTKNWKKDETLTEKMERSPDERHTHKHMKV